MGNSRGGLRIIDQDAIKHVDVFQVVLLNAAEHTPLPELLDIFGKESVVKFLDIFSGVTFQVPSKEVLTTSARDVDIYVTLARTGTDSEQTVSDLSTKYDVSAQQVRDCYDRVDILMKKLRDVL